MTRPAHLAAIDAVRFGCALMVMAHHYATMFAIGSNSFLHEHAADVMLPRDGTAWSWAGWVGVEIFFVVSGYVIASSGAAGTGIGFLRRRALRLAPAAWACATITAMVVVTARWLTPGEAALHWLASVTFWPLGPTIDASYWTLGIELAFYLLVAVRLDGRNNRREIEWLGLALATATAVYWAMRYTGAFAIGDSRAADLMLLPYGGCFATGIALWAIRADGVTRARIVMLALGLGGATAQIVKEAARMAGGLGLDAGPTLPLMLFAGAVLCIAAAGRLQRPLARWPGARALAFAGLATYPLYLIHQHVGAVVIAALCRARVPGHAAMILAAVLCCALAAMVVTTIEPPLRRWLAGFSPRRAPHRDSLPSASPPTG